jgi:hypothetical protein
MQSAAVWQRSHLDREPRNTDKEARMRFEEMEGRAGAKGGLQPTTGRSGGAGAWSAGVMDAALQRRFSGHLEPKSGSYNDTVCMSFSKIPTLWQQSQFMLVNCRRCHYWNLVRFCGMQQLSPPNMMAPVGTMMIATDHYCDNAHQ